jgi:hypothetical protein
VTALVQVEVIKDLLEELWVLAGQLKDARFDLTEKVLNSLLSDGGVLLFWYLPGGFHHADEVLI